MNAGRVLGVAFVAAVLAIPSCDPIVGQSLSNAPMNRCDVASDCAGYDPGADGKAPGCFGEGFGRRCIVGEPERQDREYPSWIVVHVPDSSLYAAGITFAINSARFGAGSNASCFPPCLQLPQLGQVDGVYEVTRAVAAQTAYPLDLADGTSIPVRAVYTPLGPNVNDPPLALPLDPIEAVTRRSIDENTNAEVVRYSRPLPVGRYRRTLFPEPPFDGYFPPRDEIVTISAGAQRDAFRLGQTAPLDDPSDDDIGTRVAVVSRTAGLGGWRVWLEDEATGRRISTLKTLASGSEATTRLDTVGEELANGVQAVVAPPVGYIGVPSLVNPLPGGQGLRNLVYPPLPAPVSVTGLVAARTADGTIAGFPARVTFASTSLLSLREDGASSGAQPSVLLHYETSLSTDNAGRFLTVLPPGSYNARIEPVEGTGFALASQRIDVGLDATQIALEVAPKTRATGRVSVSSDRPMAFGEVFALPRTAADTLPAAPGLPITLRPRSARAQTDIDGNFALALDPGSYVVTAVPEPGTGFPRVAFRYDVTSGEDALIPDVRVPTPGSLDLIVRAPTAPLIVTIPRATVRIFAEAAATGGATSFIEVGSALTDRDGHAEILLARKPR